MIQILIALSISLIVSVIWAIGIHNSKDSWKQDNDDTLFP
jgi:hypothetical protein